MLSDLSLSMVRLRAWRGLEAEEPPAATPDPRALTRDVSASATPGVLAELGSFTLMPEAQGQWNVPFTVRAQGFAQGGTAALATQTVTASYQENEQRELFVYLLARCQGVACCAGQTCGCNGCEAQPASRTLPRDTAAPACGAGAADAGVLEASVCAASDAGLDATGEAGQDAATSEGGDASTGDGGPCVPGSARQCYEPSSPLAGVGACTRGMQFCLLGGVYSACMGMGMPTSELCDNIDNNCNGTVDEGLTVTCFADRDGDGYASLSAVAEQRCPVMGRDATGGCPAGFTNRAPSSTQLSTVDCDDTNAQRSPGLPELCGAPPLDEDCDGITDPPTLCGPCMGSPPRACALPGRCSTGMQTCSSAGWGPCSVTPVTETCNGLDDDCNGSVDDGLGTTSCGSGACRRTVQNCAAGVLQTCTPDSSRSTAEVCDSIDNDCDGVVDNGVRVLCYPDTDGDTYPPAGASSSQQCFTASRSSVGGCPPGFTNRAPASSPDCNDTAPSINPAAPEVCDAAMVDENCSGMANEGCNCTTGMLRTCSQPGRCASGMQTCVAGMWGACSIAPVAETCNGIDDDCNGMVDDALPNATCGVGVCQRTVPSCSSGMSVTCVMDVSRMGAEVCDNADNDCNGMTDDGAAASSCTAIQNAARSCSAGVCGYTTCNAGYGDCDGNRLNGCETALNTASNCGSCGMSCGAGGACTGGTACDTISELAAGGTTACVRRSGGALACWGGNAAGQLGTATTAASSAVAVAVGGSPLLPLNAVTGLSVGSNTVCVVQGGNAICWGGNSHGELGRGTTSTFERTPSRVMLSATSPLSGVQEVRVGADFACARSTMAGSSTIHCWGSNAFGLLGVGTEDSSAHSYATPVPTPMVAGTSATWLGLQAAGQTTACATAQVPVSGGTSYTGIYCWGDGSLGGLGIGSSPGATRPTLVNAPMAATPAMGVLGLATTAGTASGNCYRLAGGTTYCFGENYWGNLGNGSNANTNAATTAVRAGSTSLSLAGLALGVRHSCGFTASGATYCWGDNDAAQLGVASAGNACAIPPTTGGCSNVGLVVTGVQASSLAAGDSFTCALPSGAPSRAVRCWGDTGSGQCGSVSASPVVTPALIGGL